MRVRLARPDDIPALPLLEDSAGQAFRGTDQDWIADDIVIEADAYPPLVAAGGVWVSEADDGTVTGFVATEPLDDALHILEMAVHQDHQRQGIGARLMAAALDHGKRASYPAATLTTFRTIPWNAPFYARLGFLILDEPSPALQAILAEEAARGLTDRCAMRLVF
ncbi:MAG: GNAT family N-acetyltransferase [Phenylobacterium sp.]|uniref:GNAT family N-acetyltransferase n=1 Tax=Phenylobacterium sp. TaxID=1871053 RepID=UPI001B71BB83|nr:GNAT family N-acetyltransferase [Phenylobacterium sp.]MBP7817715.1 GNAT family N-acetyltransferase [Phenylobacterium sp.]MBP9231395.1 GNAT family N-acetyltransferase [Phenylobacterium sp.]MBP9754413.1 GNAT family N-acetyltransferase [Phenylobacterium sp.]